MTDYLPIALSDIDRDSPVNQPLMTALRDNPIAIAEGSSGAPRVQLNAFPNLTPGATVKLHVIRSETTGSGTTGPLFVVNIMQYGTLTYRVQAKMTIGSGVINLTRLRAGAATVVASPTLTSSYVYYSADIAVQPGDQLYCNISTTGDWAIVNGQILTGGEDLFPASFFGFYENMGA